MISCFQCEDLSKVLLVFKCETNWSNVKLITAFCTIHVWYYQGFINITFMCSSSNKYMYMYMVKYMYMNNHSYDLLFFCYIVGLCYWNIGICWCKR